LLKKILERKLSKEMPSTRDGFYPVVSMTCRSPQIHVEVDAMFNHSSIKAPLDLEPVRTKEPLHTLIPLELFFTALVR
jgi:hypothetical protein